MPRQLWGTFVWGFGAFSVFLCLPKETAALDKSLWFQFSLEFVG